MSWTSKGANVIFGLSKATAGDTIADAVAARLEDKMERTSGMIREVVGSVDAYGRDD